MSDIMNKIKIVSLGGLNENGKNTYVVEIDEKISALYEEKKPFSVQLEKLSAEEKSIKSELTKPR